MSEIVKEYAKGEDFAVIWKPGKCIHSEICVKTLPEVYKPKDKPWIQTENAEVEALKKQIDQCPSGALTYRDSRTSSGGDTQAAAQIKAKVIPGGPVLFEGEIALEVNGENQKLEGSNAFCRCGASTNKPFCDGSHRKIDFDS